VWSILRPRRYDSAVSSTVLMAACEHKPAAKPAVPVIETAGVSRVYG
jgi:hypothetical protein